MRVIDLTTNDGQSPVGDELRELSKDELKNLSGGASAFLHGELVDSQAAPTDLSAAQGSTQASFPLGIANARFTQSGTTLCHWSGCTSYISGC